MQPIRTVAGRKFFFSNMLEEILDIRNVTKALKQVTANKGAGGVDGMQTDELGDYLNANWQILRKSISEGNYKPQPVRKVEIPKPQGGVRMLGIPTVIDRLLQQAIAQWLSLRYEGEFSNYSYGFREGRSAHQAVMQAQLNLNEGFEWVVELDLEKFFDKVHHDRLMSTLAKKLTDKPTLKLIRSYLTSGIMEGGVASPRTEGTPQGSPLTLRTHSQTLSFSEGWRLREASFDYIIKSITFMINGKSAELRVGQTHQPGVYDVAKQQASAPYSRKADSEVWSISGTGLPLYTVSPGDQRENGYTGKFCSVYCKAATYTDQADKEIIGIQRAIDQQSGSYCAGRIFSKEGPCPKRSNNLRYHLPMIVCGSKSSLRFITFLFRPANLFFSLSKHRMN